MLSRFIDRRAMSKNKSTVNRQRFLRRFKTQIKKAVTEVINKRSITDIDRGEKVIIPAKVITEPRFRYGKGGRWESVFAGNKEFTTGDHIQRPPVGEGGGAESQATNSGEGWDDFEFELSREEFLELFFADLALPNLVKTQILRLPTYKSIHAGFTRYGIPANLSVIRSLKTAYARRIALSAANRKKLILAEQRLQELMLTATEDVPEVSALKKEIVTLTSRIKKVHFLDPVDLRFHSRVKQNLPTTQAVMFCIMDVSGSMDEAKKEMAKRFFILLYLFLMRNYEKIDLVFIRHHTIAKEVAEQEFFYSRETGGTVVSSALELVRDVIRERYPAGLWNIYAAQASDGDNWSADSPYCQELLLKYLVPAMQYFAYVEIMPRYHQSLWDAYTPILEQYGNFAMQTINEPGDIYPVFRELFKRKMA